MGIVLSSRNSSDVWLPLVVTSGDSVVVRIDVVVVASTNRTTSFRYSGKCLKVIGQQ